jgi:hypothetical protein
MIKGFLDNLLCMVSQSRHERRWKASIKLSNFELKSRARKARFEELYPDYQPTQRPFYGCSQNAPWYRAEVEHNRLYQEWLEYFEQEVLRRGLKFPFPLIVPYEWAPEIYVAPIGIEIDPDPCTKMARWTGVGYLQDSNCKCQSCQSKLVDYRVHGWDRIERPTSIIKP